MVEERITLIILTVLCVSYLLFSMRKGIPESLSATYYDLGGKGWLFQVFMFIEAILMFFVWLPLVSEWHEWLVFLSCSSLLFVSAAPSFRLELDGLVHYSSAVVSCVCIILWQILEGLWDVTLLFLWIGGMLALTWKDKWCWWVECAVVGGLIANLFRIM